MQRNLSFELTKILRAYEYSCSMESKGRPLSERERERERGGGEDGVTEVGGRGSEERRGE